SITVGANTWNVQLMYSKVHDVATGGATTCLPGVPNPLPSLLTSSRFAVAWSANRLDIFGLGTDRQMYHKWWDGSNWGPSITDWEPLGGVFTSPPVVVAWAANRLDIFGLGTDQQMYHKWWDGSNWGPSITDWEPLGGVFSEP